MKNNFNNVFLNLLKAEGGYSKNSNDRGGETYCGISRVKNPAWPGWFVVDGIKHDFVNAPKVQTDILAVHVENFYLSIWEELNCRLMPDVIAAELFDTAVNQGNSAAVKYLQRALNFLNQRQKLYKDIAEDGSIGQNTLEALQAYIRYYHGKYGEDFSNTTLLKAMNGEQYMLYRTLIKADDKQEDFFAGWLKRVSFIFLLPLFLLSSCVTEQKCIDKFGDKETVRDSIVYESETVIKDSIIYVPGFNTITEIENPCDSVGLLKQFERSHQTGKATVKASSKGKQTIVIECKCDSALFIIEGLSKTIREQRKQLSSKTVVIPEKFIPWYAQWYYILIALCVAYVLGALRVHKLITKLF